MIRRAALSLAEARRLLPEPLPEDGNPTACSRGRTDAAVSARGATVATHDHQTTCDLVCLYFEARCDRPCAGCAVTTCPEEASGQRASAARSEARTAAAQQGERRANPLGNHGVHLTRTAE